MPSESVKVVVRVRPLSRKEQQDGHIATTVAEEAQGTITCTNPKADASDPPKSFTFDAVFAENCTQKSIYDTEIPPAVSPVSYCTHTPSLGYGPLTLLSAAL